MWWGNALRALRRDGTRQSEEIDIVGLKRSSVAVIGECKWTARALGRDVLDDLETYKIPALRQAGVKIAKDAQIVLFAKSGFTPALRAIADRRPDVLLVDVDQLDEDLRR